MWTKTLILVLWSKNSSIQIWTKMDKIGQFWAKYGQIWNKNGQIQPKYGQNMRQKATFCNTVRVKSFFKNLKVIFNCISNLTASNQ